MNILWRIVKFILGVLFFVSGCYSYIYVTNDNIAGFATGVQYRNQELIGTGLLVGLGVLLIYSAFKKNNTPRGKLRRIIF